jgi:ATP-dependent Clp protease ATP-binding subunit ClpA
MITSRYVQVWMLAKRAMWRLRHPMLTSEHLLYACLRLHDQCHWELCRDFPVTAEAVWAHLKQNAPSEPSADFFGVPLGVSAKTALEQAEAEGESAQRGHRMTGTQLSESAGPVRSLLDANKAATSEARHENQ